jgi:hypothetical protein
VTDPVSGMPEFKVATVAVEPVEPVEAVPSAAGRAPATSTAQAVDR